MAKVTKREKLEMIVEVLQGIEGTDELVEFVENEIALQVKRAGKERKPTKNQVANEALKDVIVEMLTEAGEGRTATDIANALGEDVSVQKTSQLLRQLREVGRVTRTEGKGKTPTLFAV